MALIGNLPRFRAERILTEQGTAGMSPVDIARLAKRAFDDDDLAAELAKKAMMARESDQ